MTLQYGGDHLTAFYWQFLKYYEFPYKHLSFNHNPNDFDLITELKERTCSLYDQDFGIQVIDFYNRQPGRQSTFSFQFKSYEEKYLVPCALFNPNWLSLKRKENECRATLVDPEEMHFEKTVAWKKIPIKEEHEENLQLGMMEMEDEENNLTSAVVPTLQDDEHLAITTTKKERTRTCSWRNCSTSLAPLTSVQFLEHIFNEHAKPKTNSVVSGVTPSRFPLSFCCEWQLQSGTTCQFKEPYKLFFESHLMTHFMDDEQLEKEEKLESEGKCENGEDFSEDDKAVALLPIEEAILKSILSVESDPERIKRWLGSILLVGGGHQFPGVKEVLAYRSAS